MHELTVWRRSSTGQKIVNYIQGDGVQVMKWPGPVRSHGMGYGVLGAVRDAWKATRETGFNWLYADGPYFLLRKPDSVRIAFNRQWFRPGDAPDRRVKSLEAKGCHIRPWRKDRGDTVFVCPSNHMQHQKGYGDDAEQWLASTMTELRRHTDRPIEARWKGDPNDVPRRYEAMQEIFDRAWAIVTAGSTIGCEAIAAGIPVFTDKPCAASPLARLDLSQIERPYEPDDDERDRWAHSLCARQFDTHELGKGKAWAILREDLDELPKQPEGVPWLT